MTDECRKDTHIIDSYWSAGTTTPTLEAEVDTVDGSTIMIQQRDVGKKILHHGGCYQTYMKTVENCIGFHS